MDDKYIPQHKRLAMGIPAERIPLAVQKTVLRFRGGGAVKKTGLKKAMRGGGAVNKRGIKRFKGGGAVKKTGIKK